MDEFELFQQLNQTAPLVKTEEPEVPDEQANNNQSAPLRTGLSDLSHEIAAAKQREEEEAQRLADFMQKDMKEPAVKRKRGSEEYKKDPLESKAPLSTFGHSSRPRRSVNYASIERGDEAQAQSLVTDFGSRGNRKKPKRTRDELDENYMEENEGNSGRKKKPNAKGASRQFQVPGLPTYASQYSRPPKQEDVFKTIVPLAEDARAEGERVIGFRLDSQPAVRRASGGFRRFCAWLSDNQIFSIMQTVDKLCIVGANNEDHDEILLKSIRHVYNAMPPTFRRDWEYAARKDVFDSRLFVQNMPMPLSEISVTDPRHPPSPIARGTTVRPNCCENQPLFLNMCETIEHYLGHHDVVHLFGCDICYRVYPSRYELTKHDCKEFAEYLRQLTFKQQTLHLEAAYMYLCCSQCGLWLSVKPSGEGKKGWTYFATALMNHSCQPLVPVVAYFPKPLKDEGKGIRIQFQVMSELNIGLPLSCSECNIEEFHSVVEIEEHFKEKHEANHTCIKCGKTFGTEFMLKHHAQSHTTQTAQFANYLQMSATYQPPPSSGRLPYVGFGSSIPAIGGLTSGEVQALEASENKKSEFVEPDEYTIRKKLLRWKHAKTKKENRNITDSNEKEFSYEPGESSGEEDFQKSLLEQDNQSSSSSDSDSDSDDFTSSKQKKKRNIKIRGDLGYEHINRNKFFERPESEKEARKRIEKVYKKHVLLSRERLLDPEEALRILEESRMVHLNSIQSTLADDIAMSCIRTISLPASNCIDPLKDLLLVNKIFYFCTKCNYIFSKDPVVHCLSCEVTEDDLIEVYHAASGPHAGVRCIDPECKAHLCSVISLKTHLSDVHSKQATLELVSGELDNFSENRFDRSLMLMAKHFTQLQFDERTYLARFTDIECFMPFSGLLEAKDQPRPMPIRQQPQQIKPAYSLVRPDIIAPNELMRPYTLTPAIRPGQRIKPYKVPRTSRWYSCSWCDREYESLNQFVDHLTRFHTHPCPSCGKAFSSQNTRRTHVCSRLFAEIKGRGATLCGQCPSCPEIHQVERIFVHMLNRHFSTIEYVLATGELLPPARDVGIRYNHGENGGYGRSYESLRAIEQSVVDPRSPDYRLKQVKISALPIHGVELNRLPARDPPMGSFTVCPPKDKNIDPRLMCYMCELTFDSYDELTHHMDDHPEKWANCPFCAANTPTHFDLQKHLIQEHVVQISGQACCAFCQEHHRFMSSHILFRCKRVSRCTICGVKSNDPLANRVHIQRSHALTLRRFQCAYCIKVFVSVGEYYEHECASGGGRVYSCTCSPNKFFNSPIEFCDHFDSVHILRNKCQLCSYDAPSQDGMVKHRKTHMRSGCPKEQTKKLFILMKCLFPKHNSGYMRFIEGGPVPASYQDVDRSQMNYLMCNMGTVSPSCHKSYAQAPRTLLEALEGVASDSRSGGLQKVVNVTTRMNEPSSSDVIMLSDDEDDDCVVFEKAVPNGVAQGSSTSTPNPESSINCEVRVETSQAGYGGAQQPGYVDEDDTDLEVAQGGKSPYGEPVVKEVVDENGDDELAVVAEVENSTGTLPSSISAGREKKFKCQKCSLAFYTNGSLESHMRDHRQDAGAQLCTETYGIPVVTKASWLCRNCCVVFENQPKYQKHMAIHGDTCLTCIHCSGIAFNHTAIQNHMKSHEEKKVRYSCGTCLCTFASDLALFDHLSVAHGVSLYYFCKVCGFGSTSADSVFQHISIHNGHNYSLVQRFGACPAQLLNYDPTDELEFRSQILNKTIQLVSPSDCSHRSMLLQCETVVSCKTCHCTQAWFNYMAFNNHSEETGFPQFKNVDLANDYRRDFPLSRHLNERNALSMSQFGNAKHGSANHSHGQAQPNKRTFRHEVPYRTAAPRSSLQTNGSSMGSVTTNGGRVVRPSPPNSMNVTLRRAPPQQAPPRRIVIANSAPNNTNVLRNHVAVTTKCQFKDCDKVLHSEFDRQLHSMHSSNSSWFCRQCGHSPKSEIDLFLHYIQVHLKPAYDKHQSNSFKSNVFHLKCPIRSCTSPEFQSPKAFEKHMRTAHAAELPFEASCCDARFASKALCVKHDQEHASFLDSNGTDASCCPICGSLSMWSLPKDPHTDCLQSHIIRHGLDYRSSCRQCLKQFPADVNQDQVIAHILDTHGMSMHGNTFHCNLCTTGTKTVEEFAEHCRKAHVFHILVKSSHSTRGELVVTTGQEYENYVGLKSVTRASLNSISSQRASNAGETAQPSVLCAGSGNAALLTIAAAIGEPETSNNTAEVLTLD